MASESGYSNQKKFGPNQFKTIQTLGSDKFGEAVSMMGQYVVTTGTNIDSATLSEDGKVYTVEVVAHGARLGDYLRIETGTSAGWEYDIIAIVDNDNVNVNATLLPPVGQDAGVYRPIPLGLDASGNIAIAPTAGGATEAKQDAQIVLETALNGKIDTLNAKDFSTSAKQDTGNTSLGSIDGKLPALSGGKVPVIGPLTDTELRASAVPVSAASLPLPSGAATETKQDTVNTNTTNLNNTIAAEGAAQPSHGVVVMGHNGSGLSRHLRVSNAGVVHVDVTTSVLPSGASTEATLSSVDGKLPATLGQKAMAASLAVVIASDQSALPVSESIRTGSFQEDLALSTVVTFTAPANSKWFMIQADDTNSANIRWKVGGTATTSSGHQLQPGRSEQMELGGNVSVVSESGTQKVAISFGV